MNEQDNITILEEWRKKHPGRHWAIRSNKDGYMTVILGQKEMRRETEEEIQTVASWEPRGLFRAIERGVENLERRMRC